MLLLLRDLCLLCDFFLGKFGLVSQVALPEEVGGVEVGLALVAAQAVLVERAALRVDPLLLEHLQKPMKKPLSCGQDLDTNLSLSQCRIWAKYLDV